MESLIDFRHRSHTSQIESVFGERGGNSVEDTVSARGFTRPLGLPFRGLVAGPSGSLPEEKSLVLMGLLRLLSGRTPRSSAGRTFVHWTDLCPLEGPLSTVHWRTTDGRSTMDVTKRTRRYTRTGPRVRVSSNVIRFRRGNKGSFGLICFPSLFTPGHQRFLRLSLLH